MCQIVYFWLVCDSELYQEPQVECESLLGNAAADIGKLPSFSDLMTVGSMENIKTRSHLLSSSDVRSLSTLN